MDNKQSQQPDKTGSSGQKYPHPQTQPERKEQATNVNEIMEVVDSLP